VISKEEILKLAELSRIQLNDAEVESLQKDISNILDYVKQIEAVEGNAEKEVGLNHNVMRHDVPYEAGSQMLGARDDIVAQFPRSEKDFDVVRKIIQKDE
jgi:aspartyl/glutamyl-tRNA(Asn/Gln) amidotransferase C subunit